MKIRWTLAVSIAVVFTVAGGVLGTPPAPPTPMTVVAQQDPLARRIEHAQKRLREVPGDWNTWASLGMSYVERVRITADPTYYPRAENALGESLRLRPSNPDALIGMGMLANSRHDFAAAAKLADQAVSLNPYSLSGYLVLADAHTQLGNTEAATSAVQKALDLDPGLPALSRAAYDFELHGEIAQAREMWNRALRLAISPDDTAFVRRQLGDLALAAGDSGLARTEYTLAGHRYGLAKLDGDLNAFASVVAARPEPSLFAEYATLLRQAGRDREAAEALRLADAALALLVANGASDDLAVAEVAMVKGDCATARKAAKRELDRRSHRDVVRMHQRALECVS